METRKENEIGEDMSMSPPTIGSMQIAGGSGFGHNIDFMSQAYVRNRYSEIDIEDETSIANKDGPLPIFLKVYNIALCKFSSFSTLFFPLLMIFMCMLCSLRMWSLR